jgi:hypothetical protein
MSPSDKIQNKTAVPSYGFGKTLRDGPKANRYLKITTPHQADPDIVIKKRKRSNLDYRSALLE